MMKEITSKENRGYKEARKLTRKKYRRAAGMFLVEGRKNVGEAILTGSSVDRVFLREDSRQEVLRYFGELVPGGLTGAGMDVFVLPRALFEPLCDTEENQGVVAVVRQPDGSPERLRRLDRPGANIVVLDRVQDPGNVGTILRTAAGAGYEAAVVLEGTCEVFAPKTVRASSGGVFRIPVIFAEGPEEGAALVHGLGKKLAVTAVEGGRPYYREDLSHSTALVIGNEGSGVCPELLSAADIRVTIPMRGGLESLNASVAAGILMYEAVRGGPEEP